MNVRAKKLFTLNLVKGVDYAHPDCEPSVFSEVLADYDKEGREHRRQVTRVLPGSLTWMPGELKKGIPDSVAAAPGFRRAVSTGVLVIEN